MPGLKYPLREEDKFLQSKIVFSIFEVDPPEFQSGARIVQGLENTWKKVSGTVAGQLIGEAVDAVENAVGLGRDRGEPDPENDVLPNEPGGALNSNPSQEPAVVSSMKVTPITGGSVSLYLPIAYQVNESLNYDTVNYVMTDQREKYQRRWE